jgi:hypothetical protein
MDNGRFIAVIAHLLAGLIVWAAAFAAAYTVTAIVCARRLGEVAVLGLAMLPLSIGAITVAALAATAAIAVAAYRRLPAGAERGPTDTRGFVHAVALTVALLAIVAIIWNGVPALFFSTCA